MQALRAPHWGFTYLGHVPFNATQGFNIHPANRERWARISWKVYVVQACRWLTSLLPHPIGLKSSH